MLSGLELYALAKGAIGLFGFSLSVYSQHEAGKIQTHEILEHIFGHTIGGTVAEFFKEGLEKGFEKSIEYLKEHQTEFNKDHFNHDLLRAVQKAQLIATFFAAEYCLEEVRLRKSVEFSVDKHSIWGKTKRIYGKTKDRIFTDETEKHLVMLNKYLSERIEKVNETFDFMDLTPQQLLEVFDTFRQAVSPDSQATVAKTLKEDIFKELELLSIGGETINDEALELLKETLENGWQEFPPECNLTENFVSLNLSLNYKPVGKTYDWFFLVCSIFNEEYKNNPKVQAAEQKQLLLGIFAKLETFGKLTNSKRSLIKKIVRQISQFAKELEYIREGIDDISQKLDDSKYKNLVTFQKWKEKLSKNSFLNKSEYIQTPSIKDTIKKIKDGIFVLPDKHYIVKGDISTGKSTIINLIGNTLLKLDEDIQIIILPLSPQFQLEEDWQRKQACVEFNDYLKQVAKSNNSKTVFIVEDAHEGEGDPGHQWARDIYDNYSSNSSKRNIDLSKITLIITTRSDSLTQVQEKLNKNWKINPKVLETNPDEIVESIIADNLLSNDHKEKLHDCYLKCGKLLLIFNEIVSGLNKAIMEKEQIRSDLMNYSYEAIYEEFKRVLPEDKLDQKDCWLTLAIIWMAGGLEIGINESFINANFHGFASTLWKQFEKSDEIHLLEKNIYITSRHPAWGLLAIKAIDEYKDFRSVRRNIRDGFRDNLEAELSEEDLNKIKFDKPSVLLMTAFLNSKIVTTENLGFYCIGRHLHDKFINAADYYFRINLSRNDEDRKSVSEALLSLAKSYRNSNTGVGREYNPENRQEAIRTGHQFLLNCIKKRREIFGENLDQDPIKGLLFYEQGYYQFLNGDFIESAKYFQNSMMVDIDNPRRNQFAAMAGIVAARSFICIGQLQKTKSLLQDSLAILNKYQDDNRIIEYKCNAYGAFAELYLMERDTEKALDAVEKCKAEGRKNNLFVQNLLYIPRIYLLQKKFEKAERFAREAMKDEEFMKGAEIKITAHRILGDALLLQHKKDEALNEYNTILPREDSDLNYLDFNLRIAKNRLKIIESGKPIEEAFKDLPI